jgi:hypothetical protein
MSKRAALAALLVTGALALSACSSSSGSSSGTSSAAAGSSAAGSSAASSSTVSAEITTRLADFTAHSSATLPFTTPVTVPKTPITFAFLQCVQSVCKEIGDGLEQAATAIGAKLIRYTHQDTAATVQQAAVNALQANPTAMFFSGDPVSFFQAQLDQFNAKKIPVIAWSEPGGLTPAGITANLLNGDDYYFIGVLEADYVAAHSAKDAHFLLTNRDQDSVPRLHRRDLELHGQRHRGRQRGDR